MSKAHVSRNVSNVERSIDFYRRFLGVETARQRLVEETEDGACCTPEAKLEAVVAGKGRCG